MDIFKTLGKMFGKLNAAVIGPFRKVVMNTKRKFNINAVMAKLIKPLNKMLRGMLNIKPKSRKDYYSLGLFWVSKKLIYFLILAGCAGVFLYFTMYAKPVEDTVEAANILSTIYFDYDDLALSEFTGRANIRAANGNVVYSGDIAGGVCTGVGTLWNQNGMLVYEGGFENNFFTGAGIMYYPDEKIRYQGEFANNEFAGAGVCYFEDGQVEYEGNFDNGTFFGEGSLYGKEGNLIYSGNFENGYFSGAGVSFHPNGTKKYEGEFYLGMAQGLGTSYSTTGKQVFTGQFARDQIQYESLLNIPMSDVMAMCNETPKIFYSGQTTCFLFEGLQVALEVNCVLNMRKEEAETTDGRTWIPPGGDTDELLSGSGEDTVAVDTPSSITDDGVIEDEAAQGEAGDTSAEGDKAGDASAEGDKAAKDEDEAVDLPKINTGGKYDAYFYLDTDEWVEESELDYAAIQVVSLVVFNQDLNVDFLAEESAEPRNGEAGLTECVAIDQLRFSKPTLFSNITFTQSAKTNRYININGVNLAEAIYVEDYNVENVTYRLCYDLKDDSVAEEQEWQFITLRSD
jgi:antitoxin component YwqK of YwqJK toxin-antitoxin module